MLAVILLCGTMGMLTSCQHSSKADLVVYGKIYTAEGNQLAEAFAVKDGKFVYVGDKAGAEAFVTEGKTEVVDYSGQGLVMPGCGNAHAHYSNAYGLESSGTFIPLETTPEQFLKEILPVLEKQEDYDEFVKLVDPVSVMEYFAVETWIDNKWDWPGKNWSMWRTKTDDVAIRDATGSLQVEAVLINRIPLLPLKFEPLFHVTDIAM